MSYYNDFSESIERPRRFWARQSEKINWFHSPENILTQDDRGFYRWFEGGKLNTCYLALDQHVINGRGNQPALIYDSPVTGKKQSFTYKQLLEQTSLFVAMEKTLQLDVGNPDGE